MCISQHVTLSQEKYSCLVIAKNDCHEDWMIKTHNNDSTSTSRMTVLAIIKFLWKWIRGWSR